MKRTGMIFGAAALAVTMILAPTAAFAAEDHGAIYVIEEQKALASAEVEVLDAVEEGAENESADAASTENREVTSPADSDDLNEENGFEKLYSTLMAHVSELLSLAAFIGSLVCAVIYKSGLMPLIEKGLCGIKNAAQKIKEATDRAECDNKESLGYINEKMSELEAAISEMREAVREATETMDSAAGMSAQQTRIDGLLSGELDMLYDIFMSSALPEYEKARVGERVAKLKEELKSNEKE